DYRLPTEWEWEYACRAGMKGQNVKNLDDMAWYEANAQEQTHKIGQKNPNAWGLYDMYGNVWEWGQESYTSKPDFKTGTTVQYRVNRGGGYDTSREDCQPSYRIMDNDSFRQDRGFRLAKTLDDKEIGNQK